MVVASVSANAFATAIVPAASVGFSNTPIGPFHTTVLADFTASAYNFAVSVPMSKPSISAGIESAGTTFTSIGASIGSGNPAAMVVSIGSNNFLPSFSAFSIISLQ